MSLVAKGLLFNAMLCTAEDSMEQMEQASLLQVKLHGDKNMQTGCLDGQTNCKPETTTETTTTCSTTTETSTSYTHTTTGSTTFTWTSTTTTTPMEVPPSNCRTPDDAYTCHFWGDPHFTHLFFMEKTNTTKDVKKGGRMTGKKNKLLDFHPSGVFELAESADGLFETQVFFCPAVGETTTGVGLAIRFGDDLIQVVRGSATAPTSENTSAHDYWAVLNPGNEEDVTEFYVNGVKKSWGALGDASDTRGSHVTGNGGISTGSAFMQQMKTNHESATTILPVCTGDDNGNLVEVGTPFFEVGWSDKWPVMYEHAVTVRSSDPGDAGICSSDLETIKTEGEKFRVDAKKNLFSSKQMKSLCGMCRLDMKDGVCGAPGHSVKPKDVCDSTGGDYKEAKKACKKEFDKDSDWFDTCVMETCASGLGAVAIAKIEAHVQKEMVMAR